MKQTLSSMFFEDAAAFAAAPAHAGDPGGGGPYEIRG
jgi:hypothetical protein